MTAVAEAERVAFDNLVAERLDATPFPNIDCAWCGRPETQSNIPLRISVSIPKS